jgi:hypothetical protein
VIIAAFDGPVEQRSPSTTSSTSPMRNASGAPISRPVSSGAPHQAYDPSSQPTPMSAPDSPSRTNAEENRADDAARRTSQARPSPGRPRPRPR